MKTIQVKIKGVTPLICNRFTDEAQQTATSGNRASSVGETLTPKEDAATRLYMNGGKKPVIPQPNILKCLIEGGKYFKAGKNKITTLRSSLVPACVMIRPEYVDIEHHEDWQVDTRPVRIPATGGRILRHRPMFHDWMLEFEIDLDEEIMSEKLLRQIVDAAGKRIGLGDFRPECKGPYGRFVVTNWEES